MTADNHQYENSGEKGGCDVGGRLTGRAHAKDDGKAPDLEVQRGAKELLEVKGLGVGVATVSVDASDDELGFALREKLPACRAGVGEVDDEKPAGDGDEAGDGTFHDEDPAPAGKIGEALHLHETVGEDTGEGRGHGADEVEDGVALVHVVCGRSVSLYKMGRRGKGGILTANVPGAQEVHTSGKEARFEDTKNHTKTSELVPILDETHADHDNTP